MRGDVTEIIDELDTLNLDAFEEDNAQQRLAMVQKLVTALDLLENVTDGTSYLSADANAGSDVRWRGKYGGWALGARTWASAAGVAGSLT